MPARKFEELLDRLAQWFQFRAIDDLAVGVKSGNGRPSLYLTFDDGLRNNFTVAYPILRKRSIPAAFYVCPQLIESKSWLWTHEMRERLRSLSPELRTRVSRDLFQADLPPNAIIARMKQLSLADRHRAETGIRGATPAFVPSDAQRQAFDVMDWDELRTLDPGLITIGSHSMTHAMLHSATAEEAEYEVAASRATLESKLDRAVAHFCYPAGHIGPVAEAVVRRTYRTSVTVTTGTLPPIPADLHRLPRVGACPEYWRMAWMLCGLPRRNFRALGAHVVS